MFKEPRRFIGTGIFINFPVVKFSLSIKVFRIKVFCRIVEQKRRNFILIGEPQIEKSMKINAKIKRLLLTFGMITVLAMLVTAQNQTTSTTNPDYIEVLGKVLSIDVVKGDVSVRLEFFPHGKFVKEEDGTLTKTLKFDINSSNGKQEITFDKGKRMTPTEAILNMYEGDISSYPFDAHKADLIFYFTAKPDKPAEKPKNTEEKPKTTEENPTTETKTEQPVGEEIDEVEIPLTLNLATDLAGYNITATKTKESDETYMDMELTITRGSMAKFFSVFVMILMWAITIVVASLAFSVVFRDRKPEIAMFSFIATLIFAFVTLRNGLPFAPPIGITFDYVSFFLAEIVLAVCLVSIVVTWILRPAK